MTTKTLSAIRSFRTVHRNLSSAFNSDSDDDHYRGYHGEILTGSANYTRWKIYVAGQSKFDRTSSLFCE